MTRLLPVAAAVVVLLFSGLVHGVWTDRWADGQDLHDAAARLERLPMALGEWHGTNLQQKKSSGVLAGSISRRYVHRPTGAAVTVFLGCGRPGPASIHTPDVCYAASGFEGKETMKEFTAPAGGTFFTQELRRTRAAEKTHLRIYWSWYAGGNWVISENPRFAFVRERVLHKLYVLREVTPGESYAAEPCVAFMNDLLPALDRTVLTSP